VLHHPATMVKLAALKLWTFFRPDWRHAGSKAVKLMQAVLALPALLWLVTFLIRRREDDGLFLVAVILLVLPFLGSNADPRMRLQLDVVLWIDTVRRWAGALPLGERRSAGLQSPRTD